MIYGVLQPFLPGALLDQGIPFWKGIAIWRAVGWTLMLPFLIVGIVFIGLQAVLVAWVWYAQRESASPWLWRTVLALGVILIWFIPWYLGRNDVIDWPISDVFLTFGLGLISVFIIIGWLYWQDRKKNKDDLPENHS
jgi:hypothetical protein